MEKQLLECVKREDGRWMLTVRVAPAEFSQTLEVVYQLCKDQLGWSKATTYTVIRRLAERGIVKNENAVVTALISKEEAQASRLNEMVEETFEGSMPAFIAAFSRSKKLSRREVDQLKQLIDSYEEE